MNWKRIAFFTLVGYLVAELVVYVMPDDGMRAGPMMREAAVVLVAGIVVFGWFGFIQRERLLLHLLLSATLIWLVSVVSGAFLSGHRSTVAWAVALMTLWVTATLGLGAGVVVRMVLRRPGEAG